MRNLSNYRVVNRTRGTILAEQVVIAESFWVRARGLIGRRAIPNGFGLVIRPCNGIHTLFMSVAADAAYVSRDGHVLRILHGIKPWRLGPIDLKSTWVIESSAGTALATDTQIGDVLELIGVEDRVAPGK